MKKNFVQWLESLEVQTLTNELKSEIIERFQQEIETAVDYSGGYVDEVLWEENYTYTKGEQYFENRFYK